MEQQEQQEQQTHTVSNYSVTDIHDICDKYVRRYFEHQKTDILANLRIFARHDREINYFMDRIMDELAKELKKYKKDALEEIKSKVNEQIEKYDKKKDNAIYLLEDHLNKRIAQITKKEPYDIISKKFLDNMETRLYRDYHQKVESMHMFCFLMIFMNIVLIGAYYFKLI